MTSSNVSDLEKALIVAWGHIVLANRPDAALSFGLFTYYLAKDLHSETLEKFARTSLTIASQDWLKEAGEPATGDRENPTCSFCGRQPPEVKLAATANGFVCDSCVSILHKAFHTSN